MCTGIKITIRQVTILFLGIFFSVLSCRKDKVIIESETEDLTPQEITSVKGLYLLNEGTMGRNNATLDYFDYAAGKYHRNIYAEKNPEVVKGLGDVGNDLKIYGSKMYAVINCSNLVEVMSASDARHITSFEVLNCRYITFHKGKAYVSSYAGPVELNTNKNIGVVLEFDTVDFRMTRKVEVGYQPEEMAVVNGKLYVANSGGYTSLDYDHTVSVIDLETFTEIKKIDVDINLHHLKADSYGDIYVSSRGDHAGKGSSLYVIDTGTDKVKTSIEIGATNFCIMGDTAYVFGSDYSSLTGKSTLSYNMVDVKTEALLPGRFITDGTDDQIQQPYGIAVDPVSRDIYVTDAKKYTISGTLYCFDKHGKKKSDVTTGYTPAHIAFLPK